jgi:hypothetical protein
MRRAQPACRARRAALAPAHAIGLFPDCRIRNTAAVGIEQILPPQDGRFASATSPIRLPVDAGSLAEAATRSVRAGWTGAPWLHLERD